jgi:fatty-acid desaturase
MINHKARHCSQISRFEWHLARKLQHLNEGIECYSPHAFLGWLPLSTFFDPVEQQTHLGAFQEAKQSSTAAAKRERWRVNWAYAGTFLVLHLLTLFVFSPWFFSWVGVACFWAGVVLFGQFAIPIGYHRLLTHRSFRTPKWFERTLVVLAMCSGQETPARWVAWHRRHHQHSDHDEDPHTPLVSFIWSHINWLVYEKNDQGQSFRVYDKYARDILSDPFYMWIEKIRYASPYFFLGHAIAYALVSWLIIGSFYGFNSQACLQLTASVFLWGVIARTVWVWHITWAVNSLTHLFGYRNFETTDKSRNNWFVALLTSGEGWHNNHHYDQCSASVQIRWWEIDINYYLIRLMSLIGLASHIIPPRHIREAKRKPSRTPQEPEAESKQVA